MLIKVHGVVIRSQELVSDNRLIDIYTKEKGVLTATVMCHRSSRASHMAATQLFCYGEFLLYSKGDRYWVREVMLEDAFLALRKSYQKMALATYFCDVTHEVGTNEPDINILRLLLNALYALATGNYHERLIKATFEIRMATIIGFMPDMSGCADCGESLGDTFYLDVMNGHFLCAKCRHLRTALVAPPPSDADDPRVRTVLSLMSPKVLEAVRYAISCPLERILSFHLDEDESALFARVAETYLLNHLERSFPSLEIYKSC